MKEFEVTIQSGEAFKGRHYEAKGAKMTLCLITGMCEHSLRYKDFASFLNGKGIDVYVLDAMGQGLNATSPEDCQKWSEHGFAKTVEAINMMVKLAEKDGLPLALMGHSMGSFMVQRHMQLYPNDAKKIILCGSNGGQRALMKAGKVIAKLTTTKKNVDKPAKLLNKMAFDSYGKAVASAKTDFDWLSYDEKNVADYIADPYCGVPNTHGFWMGFFEEMANIWDKPNMDKVSPEAEVLIISGKEDPVGQFGSGLLWLRDQYKARGLKVVLHLYPNMRHEVLNEEKKQEVYDDVLRFLEEGK